MIIIMEGVKVKCEKSREYICMLCLCVSVYTVCLSCMFGVCSMSVYAVYVVCCMCLSALYVLCVEVCAHTIFQVRLPRCL